MPIQAACPDDYFSLAFMPLPVVWPMIVAKATASRTEIDVDNPRVMKYLQAHYPEILEEFGKIVEQTSIDA